MVTIRFGRHDDAGELASIESAANTRFEGVGHSEMVVSGTIPPDVANRAIAEGRLLVAEVDGAVVGWMFLTRSGDELCLGHICVPPDHESLGIGGELIRRLMVLAREAGERSIVLNTQDDVPWNRPWYERFGFEVVPEDQWSADMRVIQAEQTAMGARLVDESSHEARSGGVTGTRLTHAG